MAKEDSMNKQGWRIIHFGVLLLVGAVVITAVLLLFPVAVMGNQPAPGQLGDTAWGWGLLGAALATGLSSLGAAWAVASVGSAGIGALVEKPEMFGRVMIFLGLAEGIAIYGIIVSILILNKLQP
jgi:V/A-type H+-transporting ATPase subunit K